MPPATAKSEGRSLAYSAPALEKGIEIIELLAEAQEPLSTRAIAERLMIFTEGLQRKGLRAERS